MTARKELWVLLAMFVLPIVFGTMAYYYVVDEGVDSTVNYGELVQPIITTEQSDIDLDGENTLQGLWTLAYVDQSCDAACDTSIKNIKDTRILMNADMRRVQRIAIIADGSGPSEIDEGLIGAKITSDAVRAKLQTYPQRSIFLIDPLGNIMLHYQPDGFDIKRVIKDLKRLFKYSRIG
ncbi:MAG TPA: hypothetical protein EYG22_04820 [Candidatus Thioglobus sp.]|jgi:hypothetical protein|nr:hypothetical protein [Candidatus Thioglobus sp.]HIL20916.1 hypothetical protein [Candidatus Thioglobus sp.]